jgi:hypothetical protein
MVRRLVLLVLFVLLQFLTLMQELPLHSPLHPIPPVDR